MLEQLEAKGIQQPHQRVRSSSASGLFAFDLRAKRRETTLPIELRRGLASPLAAAAASSWASAGVLLAEGVSHRCAVMRTSHAKTWW